MNSLFKRLPNAGKAFSRQIHSLNRVRKASVGGIVLTVVGASIGTYYLFNAKSSIHEYVIGPVIRNLLDAEDSHLLVIKLMSYGIFPRLYEQSNDNLLKVEVFGDKILSSPVGVAAGLDKNAEAIDALFGLGFSYVEVGSITPLAQAGNPKPRFFRVAKDEAVINRYGFNSEGHWSVLSNIRTRLAKHDEDHPKLNSLQPGRLLAVNLGKNKTGDETKDYKLGVSRFGEYADVLVINISSPNTPGLRDLQNKDKLTGLLSGVVEERDRLSKKPPIVVKIAPDLSETELASIAETINKSKVDGVIISNTTIQRPTIYANKHDPVLKEAGGLSGKPLKPISLKALSTFAKYNQDPNLTIIGCGGISSGKDAIEFAKAGATFVQLYTAFAYRGPGLVDRINKEIAEELKKENKTWQEIIGTNIGK